MRSLLVCVWLAWAGSTAGAEPKIAYQQLELPNGLRVFVIEDHHAPMVYEVMWFRVGSKDEVPHRTGFAHLFEHLMFKGSTHLPDGLMDRLLEGAGGWSNAFTASDMTVYQNAASASFLETMLWIDADRLAGLTDTLDQAKLDNQREVVLNERRQSYENEPYGQAELLLDAALWPADHGYHWSTIGEVDDLRAAALPDVAAFFQRYYVPNNATMVIAGDVRFADVQRLVTKYFAWIPRAPAPVRPHYDAPAPLTAEVRLKATDDVQVPKVYLAWRGPAAFTAAQPALSLAADVLGKGKISRLYKRLVYDETIAQDVEATFRAEQLGGTFLVEATAKPGVDPQRLIREITEEVGRLAATPPAAAELERAQRSYESAFLHHLEALLSRAEQLADYDVAAHDPAYLAKDLERFRRVTPAQIQEVVAAELRPTARVVLTIRPGKKPPASPQDKR
ncbi:MAG: pitrilysin family protein, partial [Kofleriaceae bacterium]